MDGIIISRPNLSLESKQISRAPLMGISIQRRKYEAATLLKFLLCYSEVPRYLARDVMFV